MKKVTLPLMQKMSLQKKEYKDKSEQYKVFRKKQAQVSLEAAFAFIVAVLLILGTAYIFVWMNKCMVERTEHYRDGTSYTPAPLRIFKQE